MADAKKVKVKALVANLGYSINEAGEMIELEATPQDIDRLVEEGLIEKEKAPAKQAPKKQADEK